WTKFRQFQCFDQSQLIEYRQKNVFGIFGSDSPIVYKKYQNLPPHYSLAIQLDILLYKNTDDKKSKFDYVQIYFDSTLDSTFQIYNQKGFQICQADKIFTYDKKFIHFGDSIKRIHSNFTHTNENFVLQFRSKVANEKIGNGFGIKNIYISIDTCHESCLSCNGPTETDCLTCPQGLPLLQILKDKIIGNACNCDGYVKNNQCLTECDLTKEVIVQNGNYKICVENKCADANCINCENNQCILCEEPYFISLGKCVKECPYNSLVDNKLCIDSAKIPKHGEYLLQALFGQYFASGELGRAEIVLEGFNQQQFKMCNDVWLLGGPFVGVGNRNKDIFIRKKLKAKRAFYQINVGYKYYVIDDTKLLIKTCLGNENCDFNNNIQFTEKAQQSCAHYGKQAELFNYYKEFDFRGKLAESLNEFFIQVVVESQIIKSIPEANTQFFGFRELYVVIEYCDDNCKTCSNADKCDDCQNGYYLLGNQCVDKCPENYIEQNQQCVSCDESFKCKRCITEGYKQCSKCNKMLNILSNFCPK
ncbi:zinc finger lsd1 subclass family protein, putative, partial [Ichthyophthirius multifiliis]